MSNAELKKIIAEYHNELYHWALQCCQGHEENAVDVLQTTYLKILEKRAQFKRQSKPKTWLFSIIRNTAIDLQRKNKRLFFQSEFSEIPEPPNSNNPENYKHLLQKLSNKQGQILTLVFYHQMSIEEASKVMKINLGTARTHYARGKKNLKRLIEEYQLNNN